MSSSNRNCYNTRADRLQVECWRRRTLDRERERPFILGTIIDTPFIRRTAAVVWRCWTVAVPIVVALLDGVLLVQEAPTHAATPM